MTYILAEVFLGRGDLLQLGHVSLYLVTQGQQLLCLGGTLPLLLSQVSAQVIHLDRVCIVSVAIAGEMRLSYGINNVVACEITIKRHTKCIFELVFSS